MIEYSSMPDKEPIYTFVDKETGETTHIAANRLRLWCEVTGPEKFWCPMNKELAETFIRDNVVSLERVKQLEGRSEYDPVIMCKTGTFTDGAPDSLMADGHHRYYIQRDREWFLAWVLEEEQWRPFQILGAPGTTEEELRKLKIVDRPYWKEAK